MKPDEQELQLGKMLVEQLTSEQIDISDYSDAYTKKVEQLIEAKAKGKEIITAPEAGPEEGTKDPLGSPQSKSQQSQAF